MAVDWAVGELRGSPVFVDPDNPDVPLSDIGASIADFVAQLAVRVLRNQDLVVNVLDFDSEETPVDPTGVEDSNDAIQAALAFIEDSGRSGILYFPAGIYQYSETLLLSQNHTSIEGDGPDRTQLIYTGANEAIKITAFERCGCFDFRLDAANAALNGTTHGISQAYTGTTTGLFYQFQHLHIVGFDQTDAAGFRVGNAEGLYAVQVHCYGCYYNFYITNDTNGTTPGTKPLAMALYFLQCRAQDAKNNSWEVNHVQACVFIGCEALFGCLTGGSRQFWMRGDTFGCTIIALDAENKAPNADTTTGLDISGSNHRVAPGNYVDLAQAIKVSSGTGIVIDSQRIVSCTAGILVDSGSLKCYVIDGNQSIVIQSATCRIIGIGSVQPTRTVSASETFTVNDYCLRGNAAGGNVDLTPPASPLTGREFVIKKIDSSGNRVRIVATVDGVANYDITTQYATARIQYNGTSYDLIGKV